MNLQFKLIIFVLTSAVILSAQSSCTAFNATWSYDFSGQTLFTQPCSTTTTPPITTACFDHFEINAMEGGASLSIPVPAGASGKMDLSGGTTVSVAPGTTLTFRIRMVGKDAAGIDSMSTYTVAPALTCGVVPPPPPSTTPNAPTVFAPTLK
jgi:hypothetical protein